MIVGLLLLNSKELFYKWQFLPSTAEDARLNLAVQFYGIIDLLIVILILLPFLRRESDTKLILPLFSFSDLWPPLSVYEPSYPLFLSW